MSQNKQYRTSLYTIFIPLDPSQTEWMLVHGYSGAIDIVKNKVAQFLRKGGQIAEDQLDEDILPISLRSFHALVRRGYLTDKSPLEEKTWVQTMANRLHEHTKAVGASFCFLVAYDCNFRCPYCFENGISNNGKGWSKKTFTKDSVDRAYAAMTEIQPDPNRIIKTITLYGGEPLLARNQALVEYMVSEGGKRGYTFSAVTNGYELQHYKHLLNPEQIGELQITIDGPKRIHDTRRTHFEDGSTFDQIMENIKFCLEQQVRVIIRVNTELENFDYISELNNLFRELGFFKSKYFHSYSGLIHGEDEINCNAVMSPVKAEQANNKYEKAFRQLEVADNGTYDPDAQYINFEAEQLRADENAGIYFHYDTEDEGQGAEKMRTMNRLEYMNKFREAYENNPELKISCQDFGLPGKVMHVLKGDNLFSFQSSFCGAQNGMYILDPCGDIYTCWELVGQDQFLVGSYKDELVFDREAIDRWQGKNISKVDACSKCKYAFFCGGGCMAGALREGRGYNSPHCDGFPKLFQELVPRTYYKFVDQRAKIAANIPVEEELEPINQLM